MNDAFPPASTMLTHHKSVCLSLIALDLPLWSIVETAATLYDRGQEKFHLLLTEPVVHGKADGDRATPTPRLLWMELSPYRVVLTMQGDGRASYRHLWQTGVYGVSRYCLQHQDWSGSEQLRLRNFTRSLTLTGSPLPDSLRLEYELWSNQLRLGHYVLNLDIHH